VDAPDQDAQPRRVELRDAGEFVLGSELGRGGMGVVWEALQQTLDRPVALKTMHAHLATPEARERFAAEARILGRLEHPNVVPVHLFGEDGAGQPYLCMRRVRGVEWSALLEPQTEEQRARAARLDLRDHLRILQRVCEAVDFAHARGILHRDLKPANVLVGGYGEVLVTDWGISLELKGRAPEAEGERLLVGTPGYLPPEMARSEEHRQGPWTDVYLLGAMLYELLTGAPPHARATVWASVHAAADGWVEPPEDRAPARDAPPGLAEIALRALAAEPADRFASASELGSAIDAWLREDAVEAVLGPAREALSEAKRAAAEGEGAAAVHALFAKAAAALEQVRALFPESVAAADGVARARREHARYALDRGDLAAAELQLEGLGTGDPEVAELRERARSLRARRGTERARRRRMHTLLLVALACALLTSAGALLALRRGSEAEAAARRRQEALAMVEGATWLEPDEQVKLYQRALELDPDWLEGHSELSAAAIKLAVAADDPATCEAALREAWRANDRALRLDPNYGSAAYYRGYCAEMLGEREQGLADYRLAAQLAPTAHDGLTAAAAVALAEGRFADAERLAGEAIESPGDEDDSLRRALARFVLGDLDGGLEDLAVAEGILPDQQDYDALVALFLLARGEEHAASKRLLASARRHEHVPHVLPLLAWRAAQRGELDEAEALVERARTERQAFARCFAPSIYDAVAQAPPPRRQLGQAFTLALAPAALARDARRPPSDLRRRGEEALALGDPAGALSLGEQALATDPVDGLAWLLVGRSLAGLGHAEAAAHALRPVLVLAPGHAAEASELLERLPEARP